MQISVEQRQDFKKVLQNRKGAGMEPHWDDMKIFLAVAREESLSGAGRILKLDPATVGRRIARLEAAFEAPLFLKSPQGYSLTTAGERLLSHGEQAEEAMRAATEALAGPKDTLEGQIRIGAPDGCANYLGDAATEEVLEVASWITPVPGGVGPVTVAMLMRNAITAHERQYEIGWLDE